MRDFWSLGPTGSSVALRALGFSAIEAERLVALRLRCLRGAFREVTDAQKRLYFARWLVEWGLLTEDTPDSAEGEL